MGRARVSAAVALLAVVSALHCNPSNDKTPSSITQVYQSVTITALEGDGDIRIDRVGRPTSPDSLDTLFEKRDYRLVEPGRLLTADEAAMLRKELLDPHTYTRVPWMCIFEPEFAFSLSQGVNTTYIVLGTECHQAAIHHGDSNEFSNLTEQSSKELQAFCEGLLHRPAE